MYAAALLTLAHWYLAAFDPTTGIICFALLGAIEVLARLWRYRDTHRQSSVT